MSVSIMSAVFKCNMPELKTDKGATVPDSTAKFILLALADHANDEGEGAYPSVRTICKKTNLSTGTVVNALNALRTNGFTQLVGRSKRDTYNYTILVARIAEFQWLESSDSSGQNGSVLVAETNPSSNHPLKPSVKVKRVRAEKKSEDPKYSDFPELVVFQEAVRHACKPQQREQVIEAIQAIAARIGKPVTAEYLLPFWKRWCVVSVNQWSLVWLIDWAVPGFIPNGKPAYQSKSPLVRKPAAPPPPEEDDDPEFWAKLNGGRS